MTRQYRVVWTVQLEQIAEPGYVFGGSIGPKGWGETPTEALEALRKIVRADEENAAGLSDIAEKLTP